ncbi:MAG: hypothetical protein QM687_16020 [Ferruginibacter sp.]
MRFNQPIHNFVLRWGFIITLLFALALLALQGCNKIRESAYENYFEENVLDRDFKIDLATTDTSDITAQYTGWVFRLHKNTYTDGPMTATKNGTVYTGTWLLTEDFGKLTILINQPSVPDGFAFLNKSWRFTEKSLPVIKFAPWGVSNNSMLYMRRM